LIRFRHWNGFQRIYPNMINPIANALSVQDTMKATSLGRTKLYREMKLGKIAARKIGRKTVFISDEVVRYLNSLPMAQ
jgi:predicted DNA-binding transcriptional regulator AlpA